MGFLNVLFPLTALNSEYTPLKKVRIKRDRQTDRHFFAIYIIFIHHISTYISFFCNKQKLHKYKMDFFHIFLGFQIQNFIFICFTSITPCRGASTDLLDLRRTWPSTVGCLTGSGRPHTLKPGFAKRQFRKCVFLGYPV